MRKVVPMFAQVAFIRTMRGIVGGGVPFVARGAEPDYSPQRRGDRGETRLFAQQDELWVK